MQDRLLGRGARAVVVAAAAILLLTRLGAIDLWAPDEPRYAQVAEEVRALERGPEGLFLLTLNGRIYDQKPPLYYWLAALAGAPGDRVTEGAARLPSALAGVALVAVTLFFGARLLGPGTGVLGAAMLLTTAFFSYLARRIQLDVLLALFETLALVGFWRLDRGIGPRRSNLVLMHAAMGLGVLTKGPVGFLVPSLVMAAFLAWEGRLRTLRDAFPWRGLLLSLLPGVIWIALATALAPAGFFQTAVVDNLYGRYFVGTSKVEPWYHLIAVFPLGTLPWSLLWPLAAVMARRQVFAPGAPEEPRRAFRLLLAWVGVTLLFFSLSSGKRDLYLLSCYPAAALLAADGAMRALAHRDALPRPGQWLVFGLAALLGVAAVALAFLPLFPNVDVSAVFALAVLAVLGAAAAGWRFIVRSGGRALGQLAVAIATLFALELVTFMLFFPALHDEKSPRPVAEAAAALAPPGAAIGLVESGPFAGGLAYYSGHPVEEIGPASNLQRFFESGGAVAVMREDAFRLVQGETFSEVRARFRSGSRAMVVVTKRPDTASPAAQGAPAGGSDEAADRSGA